jgi:transcriptional regulator with XRE-family HTH domain/tetratricopeptide (TPR) repeat protein
MGRKDKLLAPGDTGDLPIGMRLRYARQGKNVSLTDMANRLAYSKGYLSGIENGKIHVTEELVRRYEEELELEPGEMAELVQVLRRAKPAEKQRPWYVPYPRNLFFTGRAALLESVRHRLLSSRVVPQVVAITGLGGIGKTQLAVEYAYRYRDEYQAVVWLNADSIETLVASCIDLANSLDLPEKSAQDRQATVNVVQRWLRENPGCLIILDNVDNPAAVYDFLMQLGESHILITTRMQAVGAVAQTLELAELNPEESMLLLLRRAKITSLDVLLETIPETSTTLARAIVDMLAGLPLALDQAGSYIEETGCGLAGYLHLLKKQQAKMLRANPVSARYPASVATTWTLSFQKIKQANPASAELLYLCAFLKPDKIYEEFIAAGAKELGPVLHPVASDAFELHRAVGELRKYSLVRTDPDSGALSIHRLVQVVIRDAMELKEQFMWVDRTTRLVNSAFPLVTVAMWHETWSKCQRYYPQAETCITLIEHWGLLGDGVTQLLNKVGKYLEERTQLDEAERMYQKALKLDERLHGREHMTVANDLSNLAMLYEKQAKHTQAEALYREALLLLDQLVGLEHTNIALVKKYVNLLHKLERQHEAAEWYLRTRARQAEHPQQTLKRIPVNDNDNDIIYSGEGDWIPQQNPGDFNNDAHFTDKPGASFCYDFTGTGIEIISDTSSAHGEVEVYLDDAYVQTVNTARISNQLTQTIIFSKTDLALGEHTLKVILVKGAFIVDALAVFSYENENEAQQA